MQENMCQF